MCNALSTGIGHNNNIMAPKTGGNIYSQYDKAVGFVMAILSFKRTYCVGLVIANEYPSYNNKYNKPDTLINCLAIGLMP